MEAAATVPQRYDNVIEVVQRYGLMADRQDFDGFRSLFTDDAMMLLPHHEPIVGAAAITDFIRTYTGNRDWSHHVITVAQIRFQGETEVEVLSNVTSHHTLRGVSDRVGQLCGRYIDRLRLVDGAWRLCFKQLKVGWREEREFAQSREVVDDRQLLSDSAAGQ